MIRADELRKTYGTLVAVDGISFEVRRGETFGLLGPNGAGKTTTIHMLAGVLPPTSGKVSIEGADGDLRRSIGTAPQSLSLYQDLTAEENVRFFGRLYGLGGARLAERVDRVLDLVGLSERRRDRVRTFSGGMMRRLNLACAMVHDPPVLLLDEPTVGVDPQSRNRLFENIESLKKEGRTILYTTHYMEEAQRLCDRVAIVDHGRVMALDTVDRLIDAHGGRSVIAAEVRRAPEGSVPWSVDGTSLRVESEKPFEEIARMTGAGLEFAHLRVDRPDLETVFLALTGRSLRDE